MSRRASLSQPRRCPSCGGSELRSLETGANGNHGPRLLPGLGRFLQPAMLELVLCTDCGHLSFFALRQMLENLAERPGRWRRLS